MGVQGMSDTGTRGYMTQGNVKIWNDYWWMWVRWATKSCACFWEGFLDRNKDLLYFAKGSLNWAATPKYKESGEARWRDKWRLRHPQIKKRANREGVTIVGLGIQMAKQCVMDVWRSKSKAGKGASRAQKFLAEKRCSRRGAKTMCRRQMRAWQKNASLAGECECGKRTHAAEEHVRDG